MKNVQRFTGTFCVGEDDAAPAAILPQRRKTGSLLGTMAAAGGIIVPYGGFTVRADVGIRPYGPIDS